MQTLNPAVGKQSAILFLKFVLVKLDNIWQEQTRAKLSICWEGEDAEGKGTDSGGADWKVAGFHVFAKLALISFHHQASFDDYKVANDEAAADGKKERVEAFEKLQAEVDALKESREVAKSAFDTFSEETQGFFEEANRKHNDHLTASEDLKGQLDSLSDKVKEDQEQNLEQSSQVDERICALKEELAQCKKDLSENITEETVKVLNILSETKMELKTDEEHMMTVVTADREKMEGRTNEISQIIENLSLALQEKLDESLKVMIDRYQPDWKVNWTHSFSSWGS